MADRSAIAAVASPIETLADRVGDVRADVGGDSTAPLTDSFVREHTAYRSVAAFREAAPADLPSGDGHTERLDSFVADTTDFENWDALETAAARAELLDRLRPAPA